jgi:PAS domain S-box-containing protein
MRSGWRGEAIIPYLASDNVTRLLGFQVAETLTMEWWLRQLHPDDRERAEASIHETLTEGVSVTEYRMRHKDGTYRWIDDTRRLVRDEEGLPFELVGVWNDITERKQAQEELRET